LLDGEWNVRTINDDRIGKVLDDLQEAGLTKTFQNQQWLVEYEIKVETGHRLDIVSCRWGTANQEEGSIEITHGYSRDHRPGLEAIYDESDM
jgi:transposase